MNLGSLCYCCLVANSCPTLCNPWTAARQAFLSFTLPVCANPCPLSQRCHPTISPSATPFSYSALSFSQHQGLFQWVSSSDQVAKVLEFQFQLKYSMNSQDWFPSGWTGWISLQSKGVLKVFSNTTQKNCTKHTDYKIHRRTVQKRINMMVWSLTYSQTYWSQVGLRKHHYEQS